MNSKECTKCKEVKELSEFYEDARRKDGLKSQCKVCHNEYSRIWSKANVGKFKAIKHKYYSNHAEECKSYARQYRIDEPEKSRESIKKWRIENPVKHRMIKQAGNARKKYPGDITWETIEQVYEANVDRYGELRCYLCGEGLDIMFSELEHKYPELGNEFGNLDIACRDCNVKKKSKTPEQYLNVK